MPKRALKPEESAAADRLRALWETAKAREPRMTQQSVAFEFGWKEQSAVSQYLNKVIPLNTSALLKFAQRLGTTPAEIFPELAEKHGLVAGSTRVEEEPTGTDLAHGHGVGRSLLSTGGGKIVNIRQYDVVASMGTGVDVQEHVEVVRMIQVNLPDLRRVLPSFTAPENLVIITGLGDSMRGTFNDGDPIVVDRGVKEVTVEGIYVLERDGEFFIKRLQRQLDLTLMMISDNPRYPPQHITDDARKSFSIFGRALGVWNFQKF